MIDSQESDSSTLDRAVLETRVPLRRLRRRRRLRRPQSLLTLAAKGSGTMLEEPS